MNRDEAKNILLLYRSSADAEDPQIAEALALAKQDVELTRWFEDHCARQNALREKFRQISAPAGLKEQIISEQKAKAKNSRREKIVVLAAVTAIVVSLIALAVFFLPRGKGSQTDANTFANYRSQMVGMALRGYSMDLTTNDPAQIQAYLIKNKAPADYILPAGLQKVEMTGCAIEGWQNSKASMICFRTGKPLPPGQQSDLWLFVIDHAAVKNVSAASSPQIAKVNRLITASWTQ
ncbi:MAG: hypothetical protein ACREDS_14885, partial [Limisphaerales bacterium]